MFKLPNQKKVAGGGVKMMKPDQKHLGVPETNHSAATKIPSGEFKRIVRDLSQLDESMVITCTKEGAKSPATSNIDIRNIKDKEEHRPVC